MIVSFVNIYDTPKMEGRQTAKDKWKESHLLSEGYAEAMSDESGDIVSKEVQRLSGV